MGRKVDFHALRNTFTTKLARAGVPQRLVQELMRHSDPRLTAMVYTDGSQLPTFAAVENLEWLDDSNVGIDEIDSQKPDFGCHLPSLNGIDDKEIQGFEAADYERDGLELTYSGTNWPEGEMASRRGLVGAKLQVLRTHAPHAPSPLRSVEPGFKFPILGKYHQRQIHFIILPS